MKQTEILLTIKLHQELFIDPKRVRLLKEIKECGSINQAAKNAKVCLLYTSPSPRDS